MKVQIIEEKPKQVLQPVGYTFYGQELFTMYKVNDTTLIARVDEGFAVVSDVPTPCKTREVYKAVKKAYK